MADSTKSTREKESCTEPIPTRLFKKDLPDIDALVERAGWQSRAYGIRMIVRLGLPVAKKRYAKAI